MTEYLTEDQIAEFEEAFLLFDREGNGTIPTKLLGTVLRSLGHTPANEEIDNYIVEFDPSETGVIDFPTFLTLMARRMREQFTDTEEELREAFRVFDRDGQGLINADELRRILTTLGDRMTHEEVDELMKECDIDKLGNIRYDDFISHIVNR